jgi:hypothetical protein
MLASSLGFTTSAVAQAASAPSETAAPTPDNIMLTIFLKHDETRPLAELNAQLEKQGFYKAFPPAGLEVVSWNIVMGIGWVVTLRLPASRLREVNGILETTALGRLKFYPEIRRRKLARFRSPRRNCRRGHERVADHQRDLQARVRGVIITRSASAIV